MCKLSLSTFHVKETSRTLLPKRLRTSLSSLRSNVKYLNILMRREKTKEVTLARVLHRN